MLPSTCVILPAAGCGERMGLSIPKQFCSLLGRPLISYTIEEFEKMTWIERIIVVISSDKMSLLTDIINKYSHQRVVTVVGETTRHRSIYCGVKAARSVCPNAEIFIIHDAVRPFVHESVLQELVQAAVEHGAAGTIRPLSSTVVASDSDGFLDHSLDRLKHRASEMPQAFQASIIATAYEHCSEYDFEFGTECLHLAQKYAGSKVRLIEGSESLWKVTYRKDLYAAEAMLRESSSCVLVIYDMACDANSSDQEAEVEQLSHSACSESYTAAGNVQSPNVFKDLQIALNQKHNREVPMQSVLFSKFSEVYNDAFNHADSAVNTLIFVHKTFCVDKLLCQTTDVCEKPLSCNRKAGVVIHLFSAAMLQKGPISSHVCEVMSSVQQCDVVCRQHGWSVYGLLQMNSEHDAKLLNIIASLVFDRNSAFSGQTFIV